METLRDWYMTVCGGWSPEHELHQIGINREAITRNPLLNPDTDRARVSLLGGVRGPILIDRFFEVVPLDERYPGALKHSPIGEVVFPEGDEVFRSRNARKTGEQVLPNNVGRRFDALDAEEFARALQDILRRDKRSDPSAL